MFIRIEGVISALSFFVLDRFSLNHSIVVHCITESRRPWFLNSSLTLRRYLSRSTSTLSAIFAYTSAWLISPSLIIWDWRLLSLPNNVILYSSFGHLLFHILIQRHIHLINCYCFFVNDLHLFAKK